MRYFVVKVGSFTNVEHGRKLGVWQVPIRAVGVQPRDVLNEALADGEPVVIVIAIEPAHAIAGWARLEGPVDEPQPHKKTCSVRVSWLMVCEERRELANYGKLGLDEAAVYELRDKMSFEALQVSTAEQVVERAGEAVLKMRNVRVRKQEIEQAALKWQQGDVVPQQDESLAVVREWPVAAAAGKVVSVVHGGPWRSHVVTSLRGAFPMTALWRAPLSRVLGTRSLEGEGEERRLLEQAGMGLLEIATLARSLVAGELEALELVAVAEPVWSTAEWSQLCSTLAQLTGPLAKLQENLKKVLKGRQGLRGLLDQKNSYGESEVERRQVELRVFQLQQLDGAASWTALPVTLSSEQLEVVLSRARKGRAATIERIQLALKQSDAVVAAEATQQWLDAVEQWVWRLREQEVSDPHPEPVQWRGGGLGELVEAQCPWPVLALARRTGSHAEGALVGCFAAPVRHDWVRDSRGRSQEQLAVRGERWALWEAGRLVELLVWGHPFVLELVSGVGVDMLHAPAVWKDLQTQFPLQRLLTVRALQQLLSAVQGQLQMLLQGEEPVRDEDVPLASLLLAVHPLVLKLCPDRSATSAPDPNFDEWLYFRAPLPELVEDEDIELEPKSEPTTPRPTRKKPLYAERTEKDPAAPVHLELDQTHLRQPLEELDELRAVWMEPGVLNTTTQLQEDLDQWIVPLRMARLAEEIVQ